MRSHAAARRSPSARGALVWTDVEDALFPAGWAANPATLLRKGAVGLSGDEHPATGALRRDAALLRTWSAAARRAAPRHDCPAPPRANCRKASRPSNWYRPRRAPSAITNASTKPFRDDLRVIEPVSRRTLVIPGVSVGPGESLWLPLSVSIGPDGLCRDCTKFAAPEHIVYATAELLTIEFENGILAMEFAAPEAGEVVLQLARRPVGPYLAAGKPTDFDWDEAHMRARLKIPVGRQPGNRVRVGIAIEAPDTSAFFNDLHRLVIGRKNTVSTMYSSAEVAGRSRLRLPEGFTATSTVKSPNEIDYEISVAGRRPPRGFRRVRAGGRRRPAGPRAGAALPPGVHPAAQRPAVPLRSADGDHAGTAGRGDRSQGRRQSRNFDS